LQHVLFITAELLTPQLLAREEKLREKRQLKQQQENVKTTTSTSTTNVESLPSNIGNDTGDDSQTSSASSSNSLETGLKRKKAPVKAESVVKKIKVALPVQPPAPHIHPPQQQQQPQQVKQQQQLQQHKPVTITNQPVALPQRPLPNSDSVLVRLSSGQVVLVPRELLKKVQPSSNSLPAAARAIPVTAASQSNQVVSVVKSESQPGSVVSSVSNVVSSIPVKSESHAELPSNVSLTQALEILRQKYSGDQQQLLHQQQSPDVKPNGILKQLADNPATKNGRTFRYVKIRAFQGPSTAPSPSGSGLPAVTSSLSEQLVKIQQMSTGASPAASQQIVTQRNVALPTTFTRIVQQPLRRTVVMSSPVTQQQLRPALPMTQQVRASTVMQQVRATPMTQQVRTSLPQFVRLNSPMTTTTASQGSQGPMKICIIHSPRKSDGTPLSPGSATPGFVVMNQQNMRQINFSDVLKAISLQNATTTTNNATTTLLQSTSTSPNVASQVQRTPNVVSVAVNGTATPKQLVTTTNGRIS
jgi:hypothetical protein